jgi:uncharacterized protein
VRIIFQRSAIRLVVGIVAFLIPILAQSAEVMPPAPQRHFNDYAKVVSSATATRLDQRLANFERETSIQFVVAVYPRMQSDSSLEDYTVRVAQSWGIGTKEKNNGAVLFVFTEDRAMFLQVGYGLEGSVPDALAKRIIEDEIKPHFKNGNFDAGLTSGVEAVIKATRGEYKGSGKTVGEQSNTNILGIAGVLFLLTLLFLFVKLSGGPGTYYGPRGRRRHRSGGWSGWSGGGGFGGGGGGGFSGGGGSFGGGGAGGRW